MNNEQKEYLIKLVGGEEVFEEFKNAGLLDMLPFLIKKETREDGIKISTIKAADRGEYEPYETAVVKGEYIRVVATYKTEEEAIRGHEKYMNMEENNLMSLESVI